MPPPYGVTAAGFSAMTVEEAQALLESDFQGVFGAGIDLSPQSNFGRVIAVLAQRLADTHALGQAIYDAGTPDGATGAALDFVNGLRGVVRLAAAPSTVLETLTGNPATSLPAGRIVAALGLGAQFETTIAATLPDPYTVGPPQKPAAWASATNYAQGAVVALADAAGVHLYLATVGGLSGAISGPSGYGSSIIDNGVTWDYAGEAVATWVTGTHYTAASSATGQSGQRVTDGAWVYLCTAAGAGASVDEPGFGGILGPGGSVTEADGYTWLCVGQGTVAIDVPCQGVQTGPIEAAPGVLTAIATPVSGWLGAYNVVAAIPGENLEADVGGIPGPGYRVRGSEEIRAGGSSYVQAIQEAVLAALIALDEANALASVTVLENITSAPDSAGRPPNSIEVVVYPVTSGPATNTAIATAIFNSKPAGVQLVSTGGTRESVQVQGVGVFDGSGNPPTIVFSLVTSLRCYAALTVHIDPTVITEAAPYLNTQAAVAAILATMVTALAPGRNLTAGALAASAFGLNLPGQRPGILDVTGCVVGSSSPPGSAYVSVDAWHLATLAKGDVTLTVQADDL